MSPAATEGSRRSRVASKWDVDLELDLLRVLCRYDFWAFFLYAFGAGQNPKGKKWLDPAVHEPLARWFQSHVDLWLKDREIRESAEARGEWIDPEQRHLVVVVHREVGKTTMITEAGQLWLHLRDPEFSSYTGCESTALAKKILRAMKSVLDGSDPYALFAKLYGSWAASARMWTEDTVTHAARRNTARTDPSLGTFGVETSIVGAHPDALFRDDPTSYERLASDEGWLAAVVSQDTSLIPVIQSDGLIVWVGTRYDDEDNIGVAIQTLGIASVAGVPHDDMRPTEGGKLHVYFLAGRNQADTRNFAEGEPTTPKVWPDGRLRTYQRQDPLRYAAQVMNDPNVSEFNPLTRDQIRQCIVPKERVPYSSLRYVITTDTAFWDGTKQTAKDETVFQVWGLTHDGSGEVYFVEGYGSNTWRAEDLGNRLVATVQRYRTRGLRVTAITDEVTMAGKKGSWALSLRNFFADANEPMPVFHEIHRHARKKELRLGAAASFWVKGFVHLAEGAPGLERLCEQMARIGQYTVNPRIKIDWADAASDVFYEKIYTPMRRSGTTNAPWEPGATPLHVDGLNRSDFEDDELRGWRADLPRQPIRD